MKRLLLALLASAFLFAANAQTLLPVRDSIGKLSISVDPRMELLGAVQVVAGYPLSTRDTPYSDRVQARFGAFSDSKAVKRMRKPYRFRIGCDGIASQMLVYSFPPELEQQSPYPGYMIKDANIEKRLRRYRVALKSFAEESRFGDFWAENEDFYCRLLNWGKMKVGDLDIVELLESYYNMKRKSYDIILCPLNAYGHYGPRLSDSTGGVHVYALVAVPQNGDGTLANDRLNLPDLLLHEFGHSFVNPSVELHPDLVAQSSRCFEPIREQMKKWAYHTWRVCVIEHLVRAVEIRLAEVLYGPEAAESRLRGQEQIHFGYVRPLVAKLREYEELRDSTGITFADYVPELLQVFNEAELYKPRFQGPANAVFRAAELVYVYPTVGDAASEVAEYVRRIADWINSRSRENNPLRVIADSIALKMPLDNCNIVCYGTVESNLLLAKYRSKLPFRVEPGAIIADRRYDDPEVRLIACMPNPENPELGMAVYTALDDRRILNINNVFHGGDDFCIFTDRDHILSRGYFEKRGTEWHFPQPRPSERMNF